MAVDTGCYVRGSPAVESAVSWCCRAAGSLVLRGMGRREHKRGGLVRAKKHGTKSGSGAPLRRGFLLPA